MNIVITQARTGSTRLPDKILKEINGKTLLDIHICRIKEACLIDKIIIATTTSKNDDIIEEISQKLGVYCYRGSEQDVLDRFFQAAKRYEPKWIIRLTSDCPLIDPELIDKVLKFAQDKDVDYCSNTLIEKYPDGQDIEVFKFSVLQKTWQDAKLRSEREHVTPYMYKNCSFEGGKIFTAVNYKCKDDYSNIRLTVDEEKDFQVIKALVEKIGSNKNWLEYTNLYIQEKEISSLNHHIVRNEGYQKSLEEDHDK